MLCKIAKKAERKFSKMTKERKISKRKKERTHVIEKVHLDDLNVYLDTSDT